MNTDGTGFHTCKESHKTESLWNHTATAHKEGEQLEDRRSVGASSCNCGDGTDQRVQSLIFMMMMMIWYDIYYYNYYYNIIFILLTHRIPHYWHCNIYTCRFIIAYFITACFKDILVAALWRWRHNSAETCRSYAKDCRHKL